jgi:hypothetical protein
MGVFKLPRITTTDRLTITPALGELLYDTDTDAVYKGDGVTVGGVLIGIGGGGVQSVTGLDTDNTDPANPVIQIAVDGVTITGDGTPGNPLVGASSFALEILDNGVSVDANVDEINFKDSIVTQTAPGKVDVTPEGYNTYLYEFYNY